MLTLNLNSCRFDLRLWNGLIRAASIASAVRLNSFLIARLTGLDIVGLS
jgi:hypothetical protein